MKSLCLRAATLVTLVLAGACGGGNTPPEDGQAAPGADRTPKTAALETGANLMQAKAELQPRRRSKPANGPGARSAHETRHERG